MPSSFFLSLRPRGRDIEEECKSCASETKGFAAGEFHKGDRARSTSKWRPRLADVALRLEMSSVLEAVGRDFCNRCNPWIDQNTGPG
jgi:hypothetical protein